jgi:hypothetical protein
MLDAARHLTQTQQTNENVLCSRKTQQTRRHPCQQQAEADKLQLPPAFPANATKPLPAHASSISPPLPPLPPPHTQLPHHCYVCPHMPYLICRTRLPAPLQEQSEQTRSSTPATSCTTWLPSPPFLALQSPLPAPCAPQTPHAHQLNHTCLGPLCARNVSQPPLAEQRSQQSPSAPCHHAGTHLLCGNSPSSHAPVAGPHTPGMSPSPRWLNSPCG